MIKEIKEYKAWTRETPDSPSREYVREYYPISREEYSELRKDVDTFASKTPLLNWMCSEPHAQWNLMIGHYDVTMTTGSHCESIIIKPLAIEGYSVIVRYSWGEFAHAYYYDKEDETKNDFETTKGVLEGLKEQFSIIKDIPVA